jgi:hypothetical protein
MPPATASPYRWNGGVLPAASRVYASPMDRRDNDLDKKKRDGSNNADDTDDIDDLPFLDDDSGRDGGDDSADIKKWGMEEDFNAVEENNVSERMWTEEDVESIASISKYMPSLQLNDKTLIDLESAGIDYDAFIRDLSQVRQFLESTEFKELRERVPGPIDEKREMALMKYFGKHILILRIHA